MQWRTYRGSGDIRRFSELLWGLLLSLSIAATTLLIAPLVALTYPYYDDYSVVSLIVSILILYIIKRYFRLLGKADAKTILKALVIFWFVTPLLLAIPFSIITKLGIVDSYFEMVSGLSGTGFTVIEPSSYSPFVNAFRATSQWVGEVGTLFLILILALVYGISPTGIVSAIGKGEKVRPSMYQTVKDLIIIYVTLTIIPIIYMILSGMSLYNAIVYTFAALATGGFSPTNAGTGDLSFLQQLAVIVTCVLGALNFSIYLNMRYLKFKQALSNIELKMLLASILFYSLLLLISWGRYDVKTIWSAVFHAASAVTTSGFSLTDISKFTPSSKFILIIAMLIGASTFSTGGGIKLYRVYVFWKLIKRELSSLAKPDGYVSSLKINRVISESELTAMMAFVISYFFTFLVISTVIVELVRIHGLPSSPIDVMFEVSSAMSGTGLSSGLTAIATPDVKVILAIAMIVGKLEIIPVLYFIQSTLEGVRRRLRRAR